MKNFKIGLIILFGLLIASIIGHPAPPEYEGPYIISARAAMELMDDPDIVIVDAQRPKEAFIDQHVRGAVSITRGDIVISVPVGGMLLGKEAFEVLMEEHGISNDTLVIIYCDCRGLADAARLWWTMKVYGHENVRVVSGGLAALRDAGADIVSGYEILLQPGVYTAEQADPKFLATTDDVLRQVERPREDVKLIDARRFDEFVAGAIPGSILVDFINNIEGDGTFKSSRHIRSLYIGRGIREKDTIIVFCRSGRRSAGTMLALYNAGFNIKNYDGSWLLWAYEDKPVYMPPVDIAIPVAPAPPC